MYKLFALVVDIYLSEQLSVVWGWGWGGPLERVPGTFSLWERRSHPGLLLSISSTWAPDKSVIAMWHVPEASGGADSVCHSL